MKYIFTYLMFIIVNHAFAQGQVEANDIAHNAWYQSRQIKDSLFQEVLQMYKHDTVLTKDFEASEELWTSFVDEQFNLKFPEYESWETRNAIYGSQFDMLYFQFMKFYCDLRINTLYDLLELN